ncbi:MAG TPA: chemotaxis-specific protein-glutamate methyltransferase CheB [Bryobacteraceae bacterium]|jgi:two-component system chemotaxis response regulator CheB
MKKIRVLVVEDSPVFRQYLEHIIAHDPRLELVGTVETGEAALQILEQVAPDVISMDIRLPGMNGFEATQKIMRQRPTPVVVISASLENADLRITMNALQAGALTVLEKPAGVASNGYEALAERLCTQLAIMSQVKVVGRRIETPVAPRFDNRFDDRPTVNASGRRLLLGVASSTGGPGALVRLLGGLGSEFPSPILLVQHIAGGFLEGFASWLGEVCPFPVEIVRNRSVLAPGKIYLAAQDHHLYAERGFVRAGRAEPVCAQRPSGTVLFESIAAVYGSEAIGVVLTGMGDDGASGLLSVRRRGGHTIAEDESTAVVYGMPAEAVRLGAVSESLPLPSIAPRILELTGIRRKAA